MSDLASVAAVASVASIEKRLAGVEGSLRRWKFACAALALVVVGVAADGAVKDAEFGTVKAKKFEVVDSKGRGLGGLVIGTKDGEHVSLVLGGVDGKVTILVPGAQPIYRGN